MNDRYIYLDYAATTPVDDEALAAALPYYKELFYNPSSAHALGQKASAAVERARECCAAAIGAEDPSEIYFTSGGTEAINWAFNNIPHDKQHVVVSAIEHDAVLACAKKHESAGYAVDYVKPTHDGIITPDALRKVMRSDTGLVCVMAVNNIVGSIQPIKELAAVAHECGALFFTDAVQAVNSVNVNVSEWGVDMLAVSGHKFYAPKGVGFLYVKCGVAACPLIVGGEQEHGLRAGTVDVPAVVATGVAIYKAAKNRADYSAHVKAVSQEFLYALDCGKPVACARKTPDIVSVVFDGVNGGRLAVALSCAGVCCSVGSACSAGSATPPKTLVEMDVHHPECAVRFSFGKGTSVECAQKAAQTVNAVVKRLRAVQ